CGALASWQGQHPPRTSGIGLLAASGSPKLNISSAESPAGARPDAGPQALQGSPEPAISATGPSLDSRPALEAETLTMPARTVEPALENGFADRNSHLGESPMMRNWKMIAAQTVLAGALIPAGVQAQGTGSDAQPKPPDTAALLKEIQEIKKTLTTMD